MGTPKLTRTQADAAAAAVDITDTEASVLNALPTADYCAQVRDQVGLTMPVLYDADGSFAAAYNVIGSELNVIVDEGGTITYWGYGDFTVEDELRSALGLEPADSP